jgi:SpoVK/Ycf46/Vps4 family AAA+-type ATPase
LSRTPHKITDDELKDVAYSAHGFVGADLASLCSRAAVHAIKRTNAGDGVCNIGSVAVDVEDLLWAMTQVKPSAMREVLIEVPNVRYTHNRSVFSYILLTFLVSFFMIMVKEFSFEEKSLHFVLIFF